MLFLFKEKSDLWQEIQRAAAGCAVVFGAGRKRSEWTEHQGETPGGVSGSVCRHSAGTLRVQFCFLFIYFIWFLAWCWNLSLSFRKLSKMRSCFHCSLCWRSWIWLASWVRGRRFFFLPFFINLSKISCQCMTQSICQELIKWWTLQAVRKTSRKFGVAALCWASVTDGFQSCAVETGVVH